MGSNKLNQLAQVLLLKKISRRCRRIAVMRKISILLKREGYLNLGCDYGAEKEIIPWDVPKGHIPVYVGNDRRRFIIPARHLNHPLFRQLLDKAEEEFGFDHDMGFFIPCEEAAFQYLVSLLDGCKSNRFIELRAVIDLQSRLIS